MDLSIIIPSYNNNPHLLTVLESIAQAKNKLKTEILIVSDKKKFESDLIKKMKIKVIQKNIKLSPAKARNIGAKKAKGKWLLFLDGDCSVENNYFLNLQEKIKIQKQAVGFVGQIKPIHNSKWAECEGFDHNKALYDYFFKNGLTTYSKLIPGANFILRRQAFFKIKGFNEKLPSAEDRELGIRIFLDKMKVVYANDLLVYHYFPTTLKKIIKRHTWHATGNAMLYVKYPTIFTSPIKRRIVYILDGLFSLIQRKRNITYFLYKIIVGGLYLIVFAIYYYYYLTFGRRLIDEHISICTTS